jgi:tRNA-dihydrouridine synthase B
MLSGMRIGPHILDKPLALAPMEDVTDLPFRLVCKELGADLLYTEFVNCEGLVRDSRKSLAKIQVSDAERPVGVQIFGSADGSMEAAAAVAEEAGPDFIDINCGCWVRKVALRDMGAGLLRDLRQFEQVVRSVMRGTSLPVTVKTRLGWDASSVVILEVARMLEAHGVQAMAVHCRTRSQGHKGDADWSWLARLKETVSIPVLGNGDINSVEDVARMFETGCDGVMIGRAAIQNPWIFREARHFLATGEKTTPAPLEERAALCLRHLAFAVEHKGEHKALMDMRKYYAGYLRGYPGVARLRAALQSAPDMAAVADLLAEFVDTRRAHGAA